MATINGTNGNDTLTGTNGDDTINGGAGADSMAGLAGDDTYIVDNPGDTVVEAPGGGTDTVLSSISYTLPANVENLSLTGLGNINGTGNSHANAVTGNDGINVLSGGNGDDSLNGGAGNDVLIGGNGDDVLRGGTGDDSMTGGAGDDTYYVDSIHDTVIETANGGNDTVSSQITFSLAGLANVENLVLRSTADLDATGNALDNHITGNAGNNVIDGGLGADVMTGGDGNDTYHVDNAGDSVVETSGGGAHDTIISTIVLTSAVAHVENYTFETSAAVHFTGSGASNVITGGSGSDVIDGHGGNQDLLFGEAGNDTLTTGDGSDYLDGGTGADVMTGGAGNDVYVVDNVGDQVVESAGGGFRDVVESSVSIAALWDNVENAELSGAANLTLIGNSLGNILVGNTGANTISGGGGGDTIFGSAGNDMLSGGNGSDTFEFDFSGTGNQGKDTITDFSKTHDQLAFAELPDSNGDGMINLADVLHDVTSVIDQGAGKAVVVSFNNGTEITFSGAGTGSVHGLEDLVASPSQIHVG